MSAAKPIDLEEFERKRAEADWELVWARLSRMRFDSLKGSYEYAYMMGRGAYKGQEARKESDEGVSTKG